MASGKFVFAFTTISHIQVQFTLYKLYKLAEYYDLDWTIVG